MAGFDAVDGYVRLVSGLSRTTRTKAVAGAKALLSSAGLEEVATGAGHRVSELADELGAASRANRELLRNLINSEVEQAVAQLGFARSDEVDRLQAEVGELRELVDELSDQLAGGPMVRRSRTAARQPVRRPRLARRRIGRAGR